MEKCIVILCPTLSTYHNPQIMVLCNFGVGRIESLLNPYWSLVRYHLPFGCHIYGYPLISIDIDIHWYPLISMENRAYLMISINIHGHHLVVMDVTGYPIDIQGHPSISIDIHGSPGISIHFHWYPWMPSLDINGSPWISMNITGYHWISMDIHWYPGLYMGTQWIFMEAHVCAWFRVAWRAGRFFLFYHCFFYYEH